jgi:hypothetical protein
LSTNVIVSGNTFAFYGADIANTDLTLGRNSGGVDGLMFSGNTVKNATFQGLYSLSRNWSVRGNTFLFDKEIDTTKPVVLLNYSGGTTVEFCDNTVTVTKTPIFYTSVDTSTDAITTTANHGLTNGTRVRIYRYENGGSGIVDGASYWAGATTTNTLTLYDSEANAIAGGGTGKIDITTDVSLRWNTLPEIVPFGRNPVAAVELSNRSGNNNPTRVYVSGNIFNGPIDVGVVAKTRDADYIGNEVNVTGQFLRGSIFACLITASRNTFDERIDRPMLVRTDQIGRNTRLHLDGNTTSLNGPWPRKLDNLHLSTGTRLEILNPDDTVNYRTVRSSGYVSNSTGGLAWVTGTAYGVGDVVASDSRNYVCVIAGTSTNAPSGTGDSFGIIADGAIRWANLGSTQTAGFVGHDYTAGGNAAFSSSVLINTTTGALILPRMSEAERDAIASPINGMQIYNFTSNKMQVRASGAWVDLH